MIFSTLSVAAMSAAMLFGKPATLRSEFPTGLGLGCLLTACCAFLYSPSLWPGTVCNGGLSALCFLGVLFDNNNTITEDHAPQHTHTRTAHASHNHDHHHHDHGLAHASPTTHSALTAILLNRCEPGSLLHQILSEEDSRRILYFTTLNFDFMFVQRVYGYLSGSLGLLSDTVHMFFDYVGLVVDLGAAVASKLLPTAENPYGWGKLNTLAGFWRWRLLDAGERGVRVGSDRRDSGAQAFEARQRAARRVRGRAARRFGGAICFWACARRTRPRAFARAIHTAWIVLATTRTTTMRLHRLMATPIMKICTASTYTSQPTPADRWR